MRLIALADLAVAISKAGTIHDAHTLPPHYHATTQPPSLLISDTQTHTPQAASASSARAQTCQI
jgi:hypothetical protein